MTDQGQLDALAGAATPGPWSHRVNHKPYHIIVFGGKKAYDAGLTTSDIEKADAAFIVALVNAYRAGELVPVRERDELRDQNEKLRTAIGGFRWVGNNLHNQATPQFRTYFEAALEDAREAMGDDWQPMGLPTRAALHLQGRCIVTIKCSICGRPRPCKVHEWWREWYDRTMETGS